MIGLYIQYLSKIPRFLLWFIHDLILWFKNHGWLVWHGWGLHLYIGKFGASKTSSMVYDAYHLCKRYPCITVLTNFQLSHFPPGTKILPLNRVEDILNAPANTLVLIDEIGTIFNSRDFIGGGKDKGVPKILFQHLCQCRKRNMQILATTQRWNFLDKQLRDICDTVRVCSSHFAHPFTRICSVCVYDAHAYDLAYTNPLLPLELLSSDVYIQTDFVRSLYDTDTLIDNMLQGDYLPDSEIAANRGDVAPSVGAPLDNNAKRSYKRTVRHF